MSILRFIGAASLCAALFVVGVASNSAPLFAQSLEDALRRSQEGSRGGGGSSGPPPESRRGPGSYGGAGSSGGSDIPPRRRWGAVAAALWKRRGIVQVAVGSALKFQTKSEAIAAALRQCRGAGGRGCKVKSTWSRGCGYITTGRNRRGAGWVARATYSQTMRDCRNQGYRCKKAIGGCVD